MDLGALPMLSERNRPDVVRTVHDSPLRIVLVVAGGGSAIITDLLDVPGASRTVLEIIVPYSAPSMDDFLGGPPPDGAVSALTARALAEAAYRRAVHLSEAIGTGSDTAALPEHVLGVACTAALATDRARKGDHRAHISLSGPGGTIERRIDLVKGALSRPAEDRAVADAILLDLVAAAGVDPDDT